MPTDPPISHAVGGLGDRLRAVREAAGLSGAELAQRLGPGWKQPKVSKIENGRQLIDPDDVPAWARATGADPAPLVAMRAKADAEYAAHREQVSRAGGVVGIQNEIGAFAQSCTFLAEYQPALVPGYLQTADYIREKALGNRELAEEHGFGADMVGHLVAAKLRNQAILYEPGREFVHVVGEAALHTRYGTVTAATLRAQVLHLARMAELPGHTFAVVPFTVGSPVHPTGWALFDRDLVRVETASGLLQITEPAAVARHVRWLDQLLDVAEVGTAAAEFCRDLAAALPG